MNKNGFSIVEMLVAIIIISLLIVLLLPAYITISDQVKRNTYNNKIKQLESETLKYANKNKDIIKDNNCIDYSINDLIEKGIIESDEKGRNVLLNPVDSSVFSGVVKVCYCPSVLDINAYYVETYDSNKEYKKEEKVIYNNKIYLCIKDSQANSITNTEYFKEVEC